MLFLVVLLPGCAPDNAKEAKIQGVVPNDGKTSQQRRQDSNKGMDPKAAGYNPNGSRTK